MSNLGSLQQLKQRLHARAMEYTKEYFYFFIECYCAVIRYLPFLFRSNVIQ
jgi:hypothetical protein